MFASFNCGLKMGLSEDEIRKYVGEYFSNPAVGNDVHKLTAFLLWEYAETLDSSNVSSVVDKLRKEGPRQICQYQFKKNDIVW